MPQDLALIHRFLRRLRQRSAGLLLLELVGVWAGVIALLLLSAALLGYLGLQAGWLQSLFWVGIFAIPVSLFLAALLPPHLPFRTVRGAAARVDTLLSAELGSVRSAVELGETLTGAKAGDGSPQGEGASADLIQALLRRVSRGVQHLTPEQLVSARLARRVWGGVALCLGLVFLVVLVAPDAARTGLQAFFAPRAANPAALAALPEDASGPALGDITLRLTYPAYLKREGAVLENATGQIQAPLGTLVELTARSTLPGATAAELKVSDQVAVAASLSPEGRLKGQFTITAPGTYRFLLKAGGDVTPTRAYPITIEEDAHPTVELTSGEEAPDIPLTGGLDFSYRARDDHGLTEVAFVMSARGKTERRVMRRLEGAPDVFGGEATWFPQEWGLKQGDAVEVWVEVTDNDTISGPKVGRSKRLSVQISSDRQRHERTLALKEALKEKLLVALGDTLVFGSRDTRGKSISEVDNEHRRSKQGMTPVLEGFSELRASLGDDNLEEVAVVRALLGTEQDVASAWEGLDGATAQALAEASQGRILGGRFPSETAAELDRLRQVLIGALERAVLSMESFANLQRLEEILATGDDLRTSADDLRAAMEELLKGEGDVSELLNQIDALEQQLQKMAKQMAQLHQESADWFQNPQGQTQEMANRLDEIRQMLKEGRAEEAQKALEDYMAQMEEMLSGLEEKKEEEFGEVREQAAKEMAQVLENLEELEERQQRIAKDTEAVAEIAEAQAGASQEQVEEDFKKALERVKKIEEGLATAEAAAQAGDARDSIQRRLDAAKDEAQMLESAISAQNLWRALQSAESLETQAQLLRADSRFPISRDGEGQRRYEQGLGQAASESVKLREELQALADRMREARARGAAQARGLGDQQRTIARESGEMGETLKEYSKDSAYIPEEWGEQMDQAAQSMRSADEKVARGELRAASQDQGAAEATLRNLREQMEETRDALQKGQRGQGMPQPGQLAQRKPGQQGQPGQEGQEGQEGGQQGQRPGESENWGGKQRAGEEIQIIQQGLSAEEYRDALMEGMRGETPQRYKRQNRDYYEKLVK